MRKQDFYKKRFRVWKDLYCLYGEQRAIECMIEDGLKGSIINDLVEVIKAEINEEDDTALQLASE